MKLFKTIVAILFLTLLLQPVFTEKIENIKIEKKSQKKKKFKLKEVLSLALKNAEILLEQKENLKSSKYLTEQADKWQNPNIGFGFGKKLAGNDSSPELQLSISQPFYFYGKRGLRKDIANLDAALAKLSYKEVKIFVYYKTLTLTYAYFIAKEKFLHAKERIHRFRLLQGFFRGRRLASPRQKIAKYIVGNKIRILEKDLLNIKIEKELIWNKLNLFLNKPNAIEIDLSYLKTPPNFELANLLKDAAKSNTDVLRVLNLIQQNKKQKLLAEKLNYPDFELGAVYSHETSGSREKFIGGQITFKLPILNRNTGLIKSYSAKVKAQEFALSYAKRKMREELKSAFLQYETASLSLKKIPLSLVKKTHWQMSIADNAFRKGLLDFPAYIEMEDSVWENHLAVFETQLELVDKAVRLFQVSGKIVELFQ